MEKGHPSTPPPTYLAAATMKVKRRERYDAKTALGGSILLACCMGLHGFHRVYTDDYNTGCLQCMTCGGCCLWSIWNWINMEKIVEQANNKRH